MDQVNATLAICGAAVVLIGLVSGTLKRSPLSAPMLALGTGIVAGPHLLGWLNGPGWPDARAILKEAARFTLAISVMGIALRTPVGDYLKLARPVGVLLTAGVLAMWAVSAGVAWVALGATPMVALLIGAAITPTDPVVASSIVTGQTAEETLPDRLRSTLSLESGANDGLGYLIVMLPLLALSTEGAGVPWQQWLREVVLIGILLAVALGLVIGAATGWLLRLADKAGAMDKHSLLSLTVALSLAAVSGAKLVGSDGILAAFAAGAAFNWAVSRKEDFEEENVQEAISKLFNLPVFVLFGAMLPWSDWSGLGWAGAGLIAGVLLLRRPVTLAVLGPALGPKVPRKDRLFLAWFAPVGVAAIYYALHAAEKTGDPLVWPAVSLVVTASIAAHGVTAILGLKAYR
jgi:NhaP-type Na+/H+ or K+/H+ antiporter